MTSHVVMHVFMSTCHGSTAVIVQYGTSLTEEAGDYRISSVSTTDTALCTHWVFIAILCQSWADEPNVNVCMYM